MKGVSNSIVPVLLGLGVIFVALALRDALTADRRLSPRRATWLRLAVVFSGVAIALQLAALF